MQEACINNGDWGSRPMSYKTDMKTLDTIWANAKYGSLICPKCHGSLTMIQLEPIYDAENAYTPYKTIIECSSCSFSMKTESFSLLGSVKDITPEYVELGSWSPSGSRVLSRYKYLINPEVLQKLKKSGELVEFLIVNNEAVQIIG